MWPKRLGGWWIALLMAVLSLGVAGRPAAAALAEAREVPLVKAVKAADTAAVRALLQQQVDVNAPEVDGTTPLHWAAHQGDLEAAQLLIRVGANVKAANRYGVTPLTLACIKANAAMAESLLKAGADPNTSLPEGETVLMTAARTGNVDLLRVLLAHGADVNARESWRGQTALMWAAAENHAAAVHSLVELGADINARSNGGWTPLLFAVRAGRIDAAAALLEAGADVNDTLRSMASATSTPEPARVAQGNNAGAVRRRPAGQDGTSALVVAITNGHFELASYLLERGADPNADAQGWTALHQLAYTRRPNSGKGMPPVEAIDRLDSLELATILLARGANPNARQTKEINDGNRNNLNRVGATPFLLAAKHGDVPVMRLLAANGADPLIPTMQNASPLMVAAGVGIFNLGESAGTNEEAFEAVKMAYELGDTAVNAADANGYTALHGAALRGANPVVQFLADKGANLVAKTKNEEWTPLRIADGVLYTGTVKRADHTAELLRQLMKERGVYTAEHERDVNSVAIAPARQRQ
jgi:ankyrin repeat protein